MLLDPFYPVYHPVITKWLNRAILLGELAVCIQYALYHYHVIWYLDTYVDLLWKWPLYILACFVAISLVNTVIRKTWEIILVLIYGTSDEEEIVRAHEARRQKRGQSHPRWERKEQTKTGARDVCLPDKINGRQLTQKEKSRHERQLLREAN